jgi:hypothetical protein
MKHSKESSLVYGLPISLIFWVVIILAIIGIVKLCGG